jgi:hypothetical protein
MTYRCLIGLLFVGLSVFAMDDDNSSQDSEERQEQGDEDQPENITRPTDRCDIAGAAWYFSSIQNRKDLSEEVIKQQIQEAFAQYYLSPTFKNHGGMQSLNNLAEQHGTVLVFSMKDAPQAIKQALFDPYAWRNAIVVVAVTSGAVFIVSATGQIFRDFSRIVIDNTTAIAAGSCQMCMQFWMHDWRTNSWVLRFYDNAYQNCSDFLSIANQTIQNVSNQCLDKMKPLLTIDDKNFYVPVCFIDGSVAVDKCNLDELRADARNKITHDNLLNLIFGSFLVALPTISMCVVSGEHYARSFLNKTRTGFHAIKRAFTCCASSSQSAAAQIISESQSSKKEDELADNDVVYDD